MAYDKVVDSTQLDAAITATADAIRGKTGDSALIQWLTDKGFAEAVAAIEAGSGMEIQGMSVCTGMIVPAEDAFSITFNAGIAENLSARNVVVAVLAMPIAEFISLNKGTTFLSIDYVNSPVFGHGSLTFAYKGYRNWGASASPNAMGYGSKDSCTIDSQNNITVNAYVQAYSFRSEMQYFYLVAYER